MFAVPSPSAFNLRKSPCCCCVMQIQVLCVENYIILVNTNCTSTHRLRAFSYIYPGCCYCLNLSVCHGCTQRPTGLRFHPGSVPIPVGARWKILYFCSASVLCFDWIISVAFTTSISNLSPFPLSDIYRFALTTSDLFHETHHDMIIVGE